MFKTVNRLTHYLTRILALPALVTLPALLVGCAPSGPSPAEQARFAQQYLSESAPDGAITVAELWKQLSPADPTPPATTSPTEQPPAAEPATVEPATASQDATAQPAAEGSLKLVLKARLAPPSPDLAAAIPLYPWDDRGAAFYVTEPGEHGHAGHDDNCPFCQARKVKAGAMGQLVKVVLVDSTGQRLARDVRPLLKLTGTETLHIVGAARRLSNGLVELEANQLHIDPAAQP